MNHILGTSLNAELGKDRIFVSRRSSMRICTTRERVKRAVQVGEREVCLIETSDQQANRTETFWQ